MHDGGDELFLDGALDADDEDEVKKGLKSFLGLALSHFDEVHIGEIVGEGHLGILSETGVELFVDGLQFIVVLFPVYGLRGGIAVPESLDFGEDKFEGFSVSELSYF